MPTKKPRRSPENDLFNQRLEAIIDHRHPLLRLAGVVPWVDLDERFGKFYKLPGSIE